MEILSTRMAPALKGEDGWKYKRVYDDKHARQSEAKVDYRSDRAVNFEPVPLRESGHRKLYVGGANAWEAGSSRQPAVARSVVRTNSEASGVFNGHARRLERLQEESSEDLETSEDALPDDDTDNSGDDEPAATEATKAPQKWPIIQIVEPPAWLPDGWTAVLRTRESGSKDKYYVDPVSQRRFRSKTEVNYFLQTGKSYRYKRNLALLTKPLKEDPALLPKTVSMRNVPVDMPSSRESVQSLPLMRPSTSYGGEHRGIAPGPARSTHSPDLKLSMLPHQTELPRKPYNKPGPKPKIKVFPDDARRSVGVTGPKGIAIEERKAPEPSQGQSTENRGKLILKFKRKTADLDEGQRNGKKPRPFEVVGATPVPEGKSRSATSDEDEKHLTNIWAVDHAVESTSGVSLPHPLVPSTHVSRRPISKAPLSPWHHQPPSLTVSRPFHAGSMGGGQGHRLEKASGSANLATKESETVRLPPKKESPAEQLQRLGRKLCQQSVNVLSSEYGGINTLQQISTGLHAAVSHGGLNGGLNGISKPTFTVHPPAPYQPQPVRRMRGSLPKEKSAIPMRKLGLDQHHVLVPQGQ